MELSILFVFGQYYWYLGMKRLEHVVGYRYTAYSVYKTDYIQESRINIQQGTGKSKWLSRQIKSTYWKGDQLSDQIQLVYRLKPKYYLPNSF